MIYLKKILIFVILIIIIVCYKISANTKDSDEKQLNSNNTKDNQTTNDQTIEILCRSELYLKVDLIKTIKFNNKLVLFDLSDDVTNLIKTKKYDSTDDILASNKYIYGEEKLKSLNNFKEVFQNALIDISNELKKDCCYVDFKLLPDDYKIDDNAYIISMIIQEYDQGEYNLINNKNTNIKIEAKLNKNKSENKTMLFVKRYKQKADINSPIEDLRIKKIAQKVIIDAYKILKEKYINKKYLL